MKTFHALVHNDGADSAFGVTFPDVPGCFAAADEADGVVAAACDALALWAEDQPLPQPRALDAIRDEVAADLRAGAFLIAVPFLSTAGRMVRANISLDRGTLEAIDAAATARGLTRSAFLSLAARNEIEQR